MNTENDLKMLEITNRIKNKRLELNMSYQDLANKTGLSKSTLQRYETGTIKNIPLDKLEILAHALNESPAFIMGWSKNSKLIKTKENKLLSSFNELNDIGQNEAIKRVDELTQIDKYVNKNHIDTMAAHNDHLDEEGEIEKIYQDLDDMKKW
ncbi:helix-turn-helix domain-containing protein [Clostridioides sp. ES-S-0001-03]|uniref:helix-turn-helix domain-containing protein n=1 Tax=Clostridioides sp. ES-S-0001-03 TaxID=2770771 RepID=UPI001D0CB093|nr:helix-turn-helix domain-containing protein [Clostridioides difficile]MCC0652186.1 helix-turn-helix transcriptional regulator [Clostridioides sp. ES-S-0001-03]